MKDTIKGKILPYFCPLFFAFLLFLRLPRGVCPGEPKLWAERRGDSSPSSSLHSESGSEWQREIGAGWQKAKGLAMTIKKVAMALPLSLRGASLLSLRGAVATKQSHALRGNPKLKALNPFDFAQDRPKQYQRANIKTQNDKLKGKNLPHFCPLIFDFCFPGMSNPP